MTSAVNKSNGVDSLTSKVTFILFASFCNGKAKNSFFGFRNESINENFNNKFLCNIKNHKP